VFYNFPVNSTAEEVKAYLNGQKALVNSKFFQHLRNSDYSAAMVTYTSPKEVVAHARRAEARVFTYFDDDDEEFDILTQCAYGNGRSRGLVKFLEILDT